jgi:hypothetical protein
MPPFTWAVLSWEADMFEGDLCMEQKANVIGEFQFQGNKTRDDNNEGETNLLLLLKQSSSCDLRGARTLSNGASLVQYMLVAFFDFTIHSLLQQS